MLDLANPVGVQGAEIGAGEIKLSHIVGGRPQRAPLSREISLDHLAEGALGRGPLRRLLVLRILPERDPGKELAYALPRLRGGEPLGGAEGDAPGMPAGAILRDVGTPLPLEAQAEAGELAVPRKELTLTFAQGESGNGLSVESKLHG